MLKKIPKKYIFVVMLLALPLIIVMFIPGGLLDITSTPEFCNSCHVMNDRYDVWLLTGVHRNIKCTDCHIPNNNFANHLLWKSIDGFIEVFLFYTRMYSEPIIASGHAKEVLQDNCIRCHGQMVSQIDNEARNCWSCHKRMNHKFADFSYSEIK